MIKAIIFDLFGTLSEGRCNPERHIILEFHLSLPRDRVERVVCGTKFRSMPSYVDILIRDLKLPKTQESKRKLNRIFDKELCKEKMKPGIVPLLRWARKSGYKLGVISNIPNPRYDVLGQHRLRKLFDAIIFSYELGRTKPDPLLFRKALEKLGVKPSEAVMVGNTIRTDMVGARRMGIKSVLLDPRREHPSFSRRIASLNGLKKFL